LQQQNITEDRIVFYDSDCMLCSKTIRFLLKVDRQNKLKFASLGGSTSKLLNIQDLVSGEGSVVFYNKGKVHLQSNAALQITRQLPFPWRILFIFIAIPPCLRNAIYRWVANNRYEWFGKTNNCELVEQQFAERILD
jgi:predicted DCC family thiol-disulfide oxidoreductase YuxK